MKRIHLNRASEWLKGAAHCERLAARQRQFLRMSFKFDKEKSNEQIEVYDWFFARSRPGDVCPDEPRANGHELSIRRLDDQLQCDCGGIIGYFP
jgi:hypothetical protein